MYVFHSALIYLGYGAAFLAFVFCVVALFVRSDDAIESAGNGVKAGAWALLLALASSILDRLIV